MYVIVTEPSSNEVLLKRELKDDESINSPIDYAREWANAYGVEIDEEDKGYIPSCSGDIRVEILEDPENTVHIWTGANYYIKREDY